MARNIWIYGNPDKTALGFPSPGDLEKYIRSDVFNVEDGRYRYTQNKNADVIVLSRDGVAHGHFEISTRTKPTERDRLSYPKVRSVYIVQKSALYTNPVRLSELSLSPKSYGRSITEAEFDAILRVAGDIESVHRCSLPQDLSELEWVLREVKRRIGQSDFRQTLIRAYGSRCAVTDCDVLDVLEAAHIDAYAGVHSNHPGNGLLLRADIHALFDADLIAFPPQHYLSRWRRASKDRPTPHCKDGGWRCLKMLRPDQRPLRCREDGNSFSTRATRPVAQKLPSMLENAQGHGSTARNKLGRLFKWC